MLIDYIRHDRSSILINGRSKTQNKFAKSIGGVWSERLGGWLVSKDTEGEIEQYNKKVIERERARVHRACSSAKSQDSSVSASSTESPYYSSCDSCDDHLLSRSPSPSKSSTVTTNNAESVARTTDSPLARSIAREKELERRIAQLEARAFRDAAKSVSTLGEGHARMKKYI